MMLTVWVSSRPVVFRALHARSSTTRLDKMKKPTMRTALGCPDEGLAEAEGVFAERPLISLGNFMDNCDSGIGLTPIKMGVFRVNSMVSGPTIPRTFGSVRRRSPERQNTRKIEMPDSNCSENDVR
jgi:hypothetical protein